MYVSHESVVWLRRMCVITCSCVWHDSCIRVTWLVYACYWTRSYVWHDSFIRVVWLVHTCDVRVICVRVIYVWRTCDRWNTCLCATWPIHMCDVPNLHVWPDSFASVMSIVYTCDIRVTWLRLSCALVIHLRHELRTCVTWLASVTSLVHTCEMRVTWLINELHVNSPVPHPCDVTRRRFLRRVTLYLNT